MGLRCLRPLVLAALLLGACSVDSSLVGESTGPTAVVESLEPSRTLSFLDEEIGDSGVTPRMLSDQSTPVSLAQFQAVVDADGDQALWFVYGRASDRLQGDWSLAAVNELPQHLGVVFSSVDIWTEVENGGFPQYFFNGTDERWPAQQDGLKRLGLDQLAETASRAIAISEQAAVTGDDMDSLIAIYESGAFDELDDAFYVDSGNVHEAVVAYIDQHLAALHQEMFG